MSKSQWEQFGVIGIDAGLCWIGDPCYILHKSIDAKKEHERTPKAIGKNWDELHNILYKDEQNRNIKYMLEKQKAKTEKELKQIEEKWSKIPYINTWQFNYDLGHPGLGICVQTGYGDGEYPVFIKKNKEGRVAEVLIKFIDESEDE